MEIRRAKDIMQEPYEKCHDGKGTLLCKSLLKGFESEDFRFMDLDDMLAGTAIGLHEHSIYEEAYFLVSGKGILTYDDNTYEMNAGDISLCKKGHSHAFEAVDDCVLVVVGSQPKMEVEK